jgi:hypothetical protein
VLCGLAALFILCALSIPLAFFHTKAGRNSYAVTVTILSVLAYSMVVYMVTTREVRIGRNIARLISQSLEVSETSMEEDNKSFPDASVSCGSQPLGSSSRRKADASRTIRRQQRERRRKVNRSSFPESEDSENERVSTLRRQVTEVINEEPNFDKVLDKTGLEARCVSSEMYKFIYGLRLVGREVVLLSRYLNMVEKVAQRPTPNTTTPSKPTFYNPNPDTLRTPTVYVNGGGAAFTPAPLEDAFSSPPTQHLPFGGDEAQTFKLDDTHPEEDGGSTSTSDSEFQSFLPTPLDAY